MLQITQINWEILLLLRSRSLLLLEIVSDSLAVGDEVIELVSELLKRSIDWAEDDIGKYTIDGSVNDVEFVSQNKL